MSVIHAEHIGSFVRPKTLLDAIRTHRAAVPCGVRAPTQDDTRRKLEPVMEVACEVRGDGENVDDRGPGRL